MTEMVTSGLMRGRWRRSDGRIEAPAQRRKPPGNRDSPVLRPPRQRPTLLVMSFEHKEDAERVMAVLGKRMARYGLTLHPDKTRLLDFRRPPREQKGGKGPSTFDFLGFTLYWRRTFRGRWEMWCKTRSARLRRSVKAVYDWCRRHRHWAVKDQHTALVRRVHGHYNYFGANGNVSRLAVFLQHVRTAWRKWLRRRSQKTRMTWERFEQMLGTFPLPPPAIRVQIWGR
jgi:RNA-directed DNA polymerase